MSAHTATRRLTQSDMCKKSQDGEKIAMFTCYDASFARLLDGAGVDCLLIGDSLGNVIQGRDNTLAVTLDDVVYHTGCVARGCDRPFIIADMPFATSQISPELTYANAARLMAAGAQMVKLEGGALMAQTVEFLVSRGIPVCAHMGLTPQWVNVFGGFKVQGRDENVARAMREGALALQDAGATMMVFEAIPPSLGEALTLSLDLITIGIGAGAATDGQVLVLQDMLDIPPGRKAKFVRNFMQGAGSIHEAAVNAVAAIKDGSYPGPEHCYKE